MSDYTSEDKSKKDQFHYTDGRDLSISSREEARRELEADMERFLSKGGNIQSIEKDVRADPPRKPESNYGSRPI